MSNLDRKSFIIAFVNGYMECNLERFGKRAGKQMLKRVRGLEYKNIETLSEIKAIHALLYNNVFDGENFTLGEVLDALNKTDQEAIKIREGLDKIPLWRMK